jgi:hypothetical protein
LPQPTVTLEKNSRNFNEGKNVEKIRHKIISCKFIYKLRM